MVRKALEVIENVEKILAIELICATQAFDYHRPLHSGIILESIHTFVRTKISHAEQDRVFSEDIEKAIDLIQSGNILAIAKAVDNENDGLFKTDFDDLFESY